MQCDAVIIATSTLEAASTVELRNQHCHLLLQLCWCLGCHALLGDAGHKFLSGTVMVTDRHASG